MFQILKYILEVHDKSIEPLFGRGIGSVTLDVRLYKLLNVCFVKIKIALL